VITSFVIINYEIIVNLVVWSFTLLLVLQACCEYHLTWAWVPHVVRELSGKCQGIVRVSGDWSPCTFVLLQQFILPVASHSAALSSLQSKNCCIYSSENFHHLTWGKLIVNSIQRWLGGVTVRTLDLGSRGCEFDSQSGRCQVVTTTTTKVNSAVQ